MSDYAQAVTDAVDTTRRLFLEAAKKADRLDRIVKENHKLQAELEASEKRFREAECFIDRVGELREYNKYRQQALEKIEELEG